MKLIRFAILVLLLGVGAGLLLYRHGSSREPTYQGKSLTFWLEQSSTGFWPLDKPPAESGAVAIRTIGTNAIPTLLDLIGKVRLPLRLKLKELFGARLDAEEDPRKKARRLALCGFAALGPIAEPAVPRLIELMRHDDWKVRQAAIMSLGYIGAGASNAVPSLVAELDNEALCSFAVWSLGNIRAKPELVVPALKRVYGELHSNDLTRLAITRVLTNWNGTSMPGPIVTNSSYAPFPQD